MCTVLHSSCIIQCLLLSDTIAAEMGVLGLCIESSMISSEIWYGHVKLKRSGRGVFGRCSERCGLSPLYLAPPLGASLASCL